MNRTHFINAGKYFGYPECCTEAFIGMVSRDESPTEPQCQAGQHTGFIPCPTCTDKILKEELSPKEFLANSGIPRICPTPFPEESSLEQFRDYLYSQLTKEIFPPSKF